MNPTHTCCSKCQGFHELHDELNQVAIPYCKNAACECHKALAHTTTEKEWVEALQIDVVEDYIRCAEMNAKYEARDQVAHMEEMRGHFQKLIDFIAKQISLGEARGRKEAVEDLKKIAYPYRNSPQFIITEELLSAIENGSLSH